MSNELTEIRSGITAKLDEFCARAEAAEKDKRDLTRLLARVIGLAGKSELTHGDLEQLRQARRYLEGEEIERCHYCDTTGYHLEDCPVLLEEVARG